MMNIKLLVAGVFLSLSGVVSVTIVFHVGIDCSQIFLQGDSHTPCCPIRCREKFSIDYKA
jgi:hypothetical protein